MLNENNNSRAHATLPRSLTFVVAFIILSFTWTALDVPHLKYAKSLVTLSLHSDNTYMQHEIVPLWKSLYTLYKQHAPFHSLRLKKKVGMGDISGKGYGYDFLDMDPYHVEQMRSVHRSLVAGLPVYSGSYSGYGIVMAGGGPYLQTAFLSLRMLRRTNCTLPVELWMVDEAEFDEPMCKGELADLGVTCRVISRIVGSAAIRSIRGFAPMLRTIIGKHSRAFYQTKALAILLSSFETILFMDADNFPLYDPEILFASHPFADTGIIAWPDFWRSSVSGHFYNISNMNISHASPDPHHHKLAESGTVESGQIMWNKRTHWKTLVLAVYYNIFGPNFFYPLFSLGAPGQGDKETFIMAARVLDDDYYFVARPVVAIGHYDERGVYRGVAMLQADPVLDFAKTPVRPFFVHANNWKFNRNIILSIRESFPSGPRRIWPDSMNDNAGYDVEHAAFQELEYIACESQMRALDFCGEVKNHIARVF